MTNDKKDWLQTDDDERWDDANAGAADWYT